MNFIQIYTILIMFLLTFVVLVSAFTNETKGLISSFIELMVLLPIFGRVLGVW